MVFSPPDEQYRSCHRIRYPNLPAKGHRELLFFSYRPTSQPDHAHRSIIPLSSPQSGTQASLLRRSEAARFFPHRPSRPATMCRVARIAYRDCQAKVGHCEEYELIRRCAWTRRSAREIVNWCHTNPTRRPYDPELSCVRFEHELFSPATVCPACSNRLRRNVHFEKEVVHTEVRAEAPRETPPHYSRVYEQDDSVWRAPPRYSKVYERDVHRTYDTATPSGYDDRVEEKSRCGGRVGAYANAVKCVCVKGASLVVIAVGTHCLVEVIDRIDHSNKRR